MTTEYFAKADATGQIDSVGYCGPGQAAIQSVPSGWTLIVLPDENTYREMLSRPLNFRVVEGVIVPRTVTAPTISAPSFVADGVAECVLSNLPDPCQVVLGGAIGAATLTVTGGTLTLTCSASGRVTLKITADPTHTRWQGYVDAV